MTEFTSRELHLMYELVRKEANLLRAEHGWTTEFEPGSWAQVALDLDAKLSADFHARRL